MKNRTKYLIAALVMILIVGFALERGTTWADLVRPGIVVCLITWIGGMVALLHRRDIDIHVKLSWVVTVLLLNGIGAVLYLFFGPDRTPNKPLQATPQERRA